MKETRWKNRWILDFEAEQPSPAVAVWDDQLWIGKQFELCDSSKVLMKALFQIWLLPA